MTYKPTPTGAELEALLLDKLPASKHYIRPVIEKMVAAMQAAIDKWGQPAQAAEPVARKQLTRERVKEIVRGAGYDQCGIPDTEREAFINGCAMGNMPTASQEASMATTNNSPVLPGRGSAVHCRIGSSEKIAEEHGITHGVHCRIGSSEIRNAPPQRA